MGLFSRFEGKMEDTFEGAADKMSSSPISPVQIVKKAEKQMKREKVVSAGRQFAPTLYTVLVNPDDDQRLFGFYPTLAGEIETRLAATASQDGLIMDGQPLVRFIVDESLKHGKFDIIAEPVSAPIIAQLRAEEMQRYGVGNAAPMGAFGANAAANGFGAAAQAPQAAAYGQQPHMQPQAQPQPQMQANPYGAAPSQPYGAPMGQPAGQPYGAPDPFAEPARPYVASAASDQFAAQQAAYGQQAYAQQAQVKPPLPYVPEEEIDYSLDYGEYTFDSRNFQDYRKPAEPAVEEPAAEPVSDEHGSDAFAMHEHVEAEQAERRDSASFADDPFAAENDPNPFSDVDSQPFMQAMSQPFAADASAVASAGAAAGAVASAGVAAAAAYGAAGSQPFAQGGIPQNPYGQQTYGDQHAQAAYGQAYDQAYGQIYSAPSVPFDRNAAGQQPYADPYAQQPYGGASVPFGQDPYGQQAYGQPAYAQQPYGEPYGAPVSQPFGQPAYGQPAGMQPGQVPPTSVFANGVGGVNAMPTPGAVRARLVDMATGRSYNIATNRVLLGRDRSCTIMVNDINASRQHAELRFEPQGVWVITDLGSTNGTLVNGQPVSRMGLREGDRVTLGITDFIFTLR